MSQFIVHQNRQDDRLDNHGNRIDALERKDSRRGGAFWAVALISSLVTGVVGFGATIAGLFK